MWVEAIPHAQSIMMIVLPFLVLSLMVPFHMRHPMCLHPFECFHFKVRSKLRCLITILLPCLTSRMYREVGGSGSGSGSGSITSWGSIGAWVGMGGEARA